MDPVVLRLHGYLDCTICIWYFFPEQTCNSFLNHNQPALDDLPFLCFGCNLMSLLGERAEENSIAAGLAC